MNSTSMTALLRCGGNGHVVGDNKHQVKLRPDTLVFTEVIEHMEEPHRKRVIDLIALLIRPTRLVRAKPSNK